MMFRSPMPKMSSTLLNLDLPIEKINLVTTTVESCGVCNSSTNKKNKENIECKICRKWFHIACIEMSKESFNQLSTNNDADEAVFWLCDCCESRKISTKSEVDISKLISDGNKAIMLLINSRITDQNKILSSLKEDIDRVRADAQAEVRNVSTALNERMDAIDTKLSNVNGLSEVAVDDIRNAVEKNLRIDVGKKFTEVSDDIGFLYHKTLINEKLTRNHAIVVTGVHDKNISDIEIIQRIGKVINVGVEENDIDEIYPLKQKDGIPRFIVKFTRCIKKQEIIKGIRAKKSIYLNELGFKYENHLNTQIYVNEHLNWKNHQLWTEAKKLRSQGFVKFVWINNGDILYRVEEGTRAVVINSFDQISEIKNNK